MEEILIPQEPNTPTLNTWWEGLSFNGKHLFSLKENGELILQPLQQHKERIIATLTTDSADAVLKALLEKFPDAEARLQELVTEWAQTEDKLKLVGKLERVRDYLLHTNIVGDFEAMFQQLAEYEQVIKELENNNYNTKLQLTLQAEQLAENENWKETTQAFKDLTDKWKLIGYIDKHRNDELWNRMEAAKTKFYDRKRQHQDDQAKAMLQNLDLKMELVEKAEQLAASESWKESTEIFKQLMDQWKTIGRTVPEKNEELWNRFIQAKNVFYDRKKVHFESIQNEQEANYLLKLAIADKAEGLKESTNWNETSQAFFDMMEEWKRIGRVPMDKSEELWGSFTGAKEYFFQRKREHFEAFKVGLEDNYAQKIALLKRAQSLRTSTRWREATEELNELMTEWKKIGPVPKEHSNRIWEEFCEARKEFFERKDADRDRRKQYAEKQKDAKIQQAKNFHQKLIDEIKEEQERLEDFKVALENVTPGHKAAELTQHLTKLIAQTEEKLTHKQQKLHDVEKQQKQWGVDGEEPATEPETES